MISSPLRYPGSKAALVDYFTSVIDDNQLEGCHFYEPYAGGASMSLALLSLDLVGRVTLMERDPLLYAFWRCATGDNDNLCREVSRMHVNMKEWTACQKFLHPMALERYSLLTLAKACLFLNRANFSGILHAGPIGGMTQRSEYTVDCRFNKERILGQIAAIKPIARRIRVLHGNAVSYLKQQRLRIAQEHSLVYIDPPYYQQGRKLYRFHYKDRQHQDLAAFLNAAPFSWVVSYDNHPFIKRTFHGQKIVPIKINYAVKESRRADELLISNIPLPRPVYEATSRSNPTYQTLTA